MAATRYNHNGQLLTKAQMLKCAIGKEVAFIGSKGLIKFHAIMDNDGGVFAITEKDYIRSSLPDMTSNQSAEKYLSLCIKKLSISESINYNMWAKTSTPSVSDKLNYVKNILTK